MRSLCEQHAVSIRAAALQFPFRHLAVDNVVIGAGTATEVRDSLQELDREIPAALWHALDELTPPVEQLPE
jgi:D-threo-aldose 1-dehydrogenase